MMICLLQVRSGGCGIDGDGGEMASRASMPIHPRLLLGRASRLQSPAARTDADAPHQPASGLQTKSELEGKYLYI